MLSGTVLGVSTDGLISYYSFDTANNTGSILGDWVNHTVSPNFGKENLTITGTRQTEGIIGEAMNFTGTDRAVGTDRTDLDGGTAMSITAWVNYSGVPAGNWMVAGKSHDFFNLRVFIRAISPWNDRPGLDFDGTNVALTNDTLNDTGWRFMAATWDGTTIRMYVDGVLQTDTGSESSSIPNTADLWAVASSSKSGSNADYFQGTIDELGLWNIQLVQDNITDLYNGGAGLNPFVPAVPANAPFPSTYNITSNNTYVEDSTAWDNNQTINISSNLLTGTFSTDVNANCTGRVDTEGNYSQNMDFDTNTEFATLDTTSHSFTIFEDIGVGTHCIYISCITTDGNNVENVTGMSSSRCLNVTRFAPTVNITDPTTASPQSPTPGNNMTIQFDFQKEGINITTDVEVYNITIGGTQCDLVTNCSGIPTSCTGFSTQEPCEFAGCAWSGASTERVTLFSDGFESNDFGCSTCLGVNDNNLSAWSTWQDRGADGGPNIVASSNYPTLCADSFCAETIGGNGATGGHACDGSNFCTGFNHSINTTGYENINITFVFSDVANTYESPNEQLAAQFTCDGGATWENVKAPFSPSSGFDEFVSVNVSAVDSCVDDNENVYFRVWQDATFSGESVGTDSVNVSGISNEVAGCSGTSSACSTYQARNNCTNSTGCGWNSAFRTGIGWEINCTVDSGCTGTNDLFVEANFTNSTNATGSETQTSAVDCGGVADSCTYSAGDWVVDCTDQCNITSPTSLPDNDLIINGAGEFRILADITIDTLRKSNSCRMINRAGDGNALIIKS